MNKTFQVEITYFAGKREGQVITWSNVEVEDILEILDGLTRDQISNAEIMIINGDERILYEDYLYRCYIQQSQKKRA